MSRSAISLPHEHGAYLTLAGAAVAGLVIAPSLAGAGLAAAVAAAFFARGPLDALRRPARFDRAALSAYAAVAAIGVALGGMTAALITAGVTVLSLAGRVTRHSRDPLLEALGMATFGALSGGIAWLGGARPLTSMALALVLGTHAVTAVPLVRTELRPAERKGAGRADLITAITLVAATAAVLALGRPLLLLGLLPRAFHIAARWLRAMPRLRPGLVGLRETLSLAASIALSLIALR